MLGVVGETRYVMGCISQLEDGRYFLEDLSASLPVDLADAQLAHGFITGQLLTVPHRIISSNLSQTAAVLRHSPTKRPCVTGHLADADLL